MANKRYGPPAWAAELPGDSMPATYSSGRNNTQADRIPSQMQRPTLQVPTTPTNVTTNYPLSAPTSSSERPPWDITLSPVPPSGAMPDNSQFSGNASDSVGPQLNAPFSSNPRLEFGHRSTRSNPGAGRPHRPIEKFSDSLGPEVPDRFERALRLQQNAFADIARRNSIHDLKSERTKPMGSLPIRPKYFDAEVAAQIKRDEELAIKLSMVDSGDDDAQLPLELNVKHHQHLPILKEPSPAPPLTPTSIPHFGLGFDPPSLHQRNYGFSTASELAPNHSITPTTPSFPPETPPRPSHIDQVDPPTMSGADFRPRRVSLEPWTLTQTTPDLKSPSPRESLAICDQCKTEQPDVAYCPACSFHFCRKHWEGQILHDHQISVNGVPHEKTDPHLAKRIKSIIEPSFSEETQNEMHRKDDDTTWFGVLPKPDASGQLLFHDFGRYEEFLSQSMYTPKSGQFPSLISFVGPTGAGKSTIVKALVKLANLGGDNSKQQTPVVGLIQHQAVPTSGEVHLYWDPCSLLSNRPLMYADCEGLGGGSREPMAARATAMRETTREKKVITKDRREKDYKKSQLDSYTSYNSIMQPPNFTANRNPNFRQPIPPYSSMSPSNTPMPPTSGSRRPSVSAIDTSSNSVLPSYSPFSAVDEQNESKDGWTPGSEKVYRGVTRKIRWAQDRDRRNRQFIVENLYPRVLYTFSDIVILVMRNPKQLEQEIERLIQWAATALEKSSNQPMLPYAMIVINAVDNRTNGELLDVVTATHRLLDDIKDAVEHNPAFYRWAMDWREKNKQIVTTKDLLLAYYTDVKIVFVPDKGHPKLVWKQYQKIYKEIQDAVYGSEKRRRHARLLLSSDQFNPYLQFAFEHFSGTLDAPFDFVRVSSRLNQVQPQFNPILCLIKDYRAAWPKCDVLDLFIHVAPLVASSIMLDVVRRQLKGDPRAVFPAYQDSFKQALKTFFDEEWPCEAIHPRLNERCVVVRTRHNTKGHQLRSGKVWSGKYETFREADPEPLFADAVFQIFISLSRTLSMKVNKQGLSGVAEEKRIAFEIHQQDIMGERCGFLRNRPKLVSHRICLCCLFQAPLHPLLCGHVICDVCFNDTGRKAREHVVRIQSCPICGVSWGQGRANVEIVKKPENTGLRVLTLDGGGIRAVIQLEILSLIEERIGLGIPIQDFFDLIVGTSGGGIVALAIGEKNMKVTEATEMFTSFATRAFKARWGASAPIWGRLVQLKYHSQYETNGLEGALKDSFGDDLLFGGKRHIQSTSHCKVAVTTTDTNREARLLANYNRFTKIKTPYQFQRFEKPDQELFVWEAARATSAAPGYFKSFYHPRNGHTYQDGALKLNNPILAADYERLCIWGEGPQSLPDVLVSIGTGYFPEVRRRSGDPGPTTGIGFVNGAMVFANIVRDAIESELDCEKTWEDFVHHAAHEGNERRSRFHRLTLPIHGPKIGLDAVGEMENLQSLTRAHYNNDRRLIDKVAGQLIASLFYFDVVSRISLTVTGMIRCRLPQDISREGPVQRLASGLRMRRFSALQFLIYPNTNLARWTAAPIDNGMLKAVEKHQGIFQVQVSFDLVDPGVLSTILLDMPGFSPQVISGFPRCLLGQESTASSPALSRFSSSMSVPLDSTLSKSPKSP